MNRDLVDTLLKLREDGSLMTLHERFEAQFTIDNAGHEIEVYRLHEQLLMNALAFDDPTELTELSYYHGCYYCGENLQFSFDADAKSLTCTTPTCRYPDGIPLSWTLEVPSGKIVVDDDLRSFMGLGEQAMPEANDTNWRQYDVNTAYGIYHTIKWYAERGMAHGFVGNSCPSIYHLADDKYSIANPGYDDNDEQICTGTELTSICTDLWWFSIMDYDQFIANGGVANINWTGPSVIDVTPGVYRFDYDFLLKSFDRDAFETETVYATFELE